MNEQQIIAAHIASTVQRLGHRFGPYGDLFIRPKTRAQMTAPLQWFEKQEGVCRRFGVLADGTVGHEVVWVHPTFHATWKRAGKALPELV